MRYRATETGGESGPLIPLLSVFPPFFCPPGAGGSFSYFFVVLVLAPKGVDLPQGRFGYGVHCFLLLLRDSIAI